MTSLIVQFNLTGVDKNPTDPVLQHNVHVLGLTAEDRHAIQLDRTFIPSPQVVARFSHKFDLPLQYRIM